MRVTTIAIERENLLGRLENLVVVALRVGAHGLYGGREG
jgi:hypothetical protein